MLRSWRLGSAFGIGIYIHSTFLLLPLWVLIQTWGSSGLHTAVYSVVFLLMLFGCVVLHELGHALMAHRFGIGTRDITLYPIGGVARLERMPEKPLEEFLIALAGPAVNVVIAAILAVFAVIIYLIPALYSADTSFRYEPGSNFLLDMLVANAFLVFLNMLPAFPMDGGRVFRALLASSLSYVRATEIATQVGMVITVLMGMAAVFVFQGAVMLLLVAVFVFFAGQAELAEVRRREAMRLAEPIDVLPADDMDQDGLDGLAWDSRSRTWIRWRNGHPVSFHRVEPE